MENLLSATALIGVWLWFLFKLFLYWCVGLIVLEIPALFSKRLYSHSIILSLVWAESKKLHFGDSMPEVCFLDAGQVAGGGINHDNGRGLVDLPVPTNYNTIKHEVYHAYRSTILKTARFHKFRFSSFLTAMILKILYLFIEEPLAALYALFGVDFSLKGLLFKFKKSRGAS